MESISLSLSLILSIYSCLSSCLPICPHFLFSSLTLSPQDMKELVKQFSELPARVTRLHSICIQGRKYKAEARILCQVDESRLAAVIYYFSIYWIIFQDKYNCFSFSVSNYYISCIADVHVAEWKCNRSKFEDNIYIIRFRIGNDYKTYVHISSI